MTIGTPRSYAPASRFASDASRWSAQHEEPTQISINAQISSYFGLSYAMMCSHSEASERATTAITGSVSLALNTSCGTPGSMKMKSPA